MLGDLPNAIDREGFLADPLGVEKDPLGSVKAGACETAAPGIFAVG